MVVAGVQTVVVCRVGLVGLAALCGQCAALTGLSLRADPDVLVRLSELILLVALAVWLRVLAVLSVLAVALAQLNVLCASAIIRPVALVWESGQAWFVILQGVFVATVV